MDFLIVFVAAAIVYSVLYFFDIVFKTCSLYPYIKFINSLGLDIGFFRVTWFTTSLNRSFHRWGSFRPKVLQLWFTAGALFTVALLPLSFFLLLQSIFSLIPFKGGEDVGHDSDPIVVPVIPGVNLPLSDIGYYVVTIAVSSIIHEVGHLAAARREDVTVAGVGILVAFIVPAAFVRFGTNQIAALAPRKQLRVVCAGIWHNTILAGLAYIFLLAAPVFFFPLYDIGRGVAVLGIAKNSPVIGPTGIDIGDKLAAINDCEVSDTSTWWQCLVLASKQPPPGYCVNEDLVHKLDESIPVKHIEGGTVECCDRSKDSYLCFEALEDETPIQILQYSCLPGRPVVEATAYSCQKARDCPPGLHCVRPVLGNNTTLLRIQRGTKPVVIFIGKPSQVYDTVKVSSYVPSFSYLGAELPEAILKLCKYFVVFSSGFAIVNTIPCFYSDGNYIIYALLRYIGANKVRKQRAIGLIANVIGSALLLVNFIAIIWKAARL